MVEVEADLQQVTDDFLDYLLEAWAGLPRAEREIDTWDLIEQIDYVEEWTPKLDSLDWLERRAAQGLLTDEQQARLAELHRMVDEYQPILERLRNS
ncbi:MAG: hypothetical protein ACOX9A_09360 [Anaerolineae bacterium]|jgi:hypothetical protein